MHNPPMKTTHHFDTTGSAFPLPVYKTQAHRAAWDYIGGAGNWWSGEQHLAIAQAVRDARNCLLCQDRKAALSPFSIDGVHAGDAFPLPDAVADAVVDAVADAVHRITTDPARLTRDWIESLLGDEFGYGHYVEMVGVIVSLISIDTLHHVLEMPLEPLPAATGNKPDHYWPEGAAIDVAWVPMIYPENLTAAENDIYFHAPRMGHVIRAMSLVPEAVRQLNSLSAAHYLPTPEVGDMTSCGELTLTRPQIELIAARTSILNDCFY